MVKHKDEDWTLPQRKPITKEVIDRSIRAEDDAAAREHQAQEAWFDRGHGAVMLKLTDGRVFGSDPKFIPSLHGASPQQLEPLRLRRWGLSGLGGTRSAYQCGRVRDADNGRVASSHQTVQRASRRDDHLCHQGRVLCSKRAPGRTACHQRESTAYCHVSRTVRRGAKTWRNRSTC